MPRPGGSQSAGCAAGQIVFVMFPAGLDGQKHCSVR